MIRYIENRSDAAGASTRRAADSQVAAGIGALARDHGIRRRHDLQPGTPHRRRRRRHRGALGPGRDPAEPRGRELVLRPGRHEPRARSRSAGRTHTVEDFAEDADGGRNSGWFGDGFRPRRRILGEEAGQATAGAAARRRDRRPDRQRRGPGRAATRAGRPHRGARQLPGLPLPDHLHAQHPGDGRLAGALHPDRARDRRGDADRPQG